MPDKIRIGQCISVETQFANLKQRLHKESKHTVSSYGLETQPFENIIKENEK